MLFSASAFAQTKRVTGTVKDRKGDALIGVSVKVKSSTTGVSTDVDGKFALDVPVGGTLVFSYIGYTTFEEVITASTGALSIVLQDNTSNLEEVVVTGYGGTAKKSDLTGATSSVTAKDIEERQPINIFDAIQGKAAGVLVVNDTGGEPGAEGTIQIRGVSSLNAGGSPLYVVDGIINPNGRSISPMDIENIEILKDAASASIYGARAANGVILITTKKGSEGKPRINTQYKHLFGKLAHKLPQSNSAEVRLFRRLQTASPTGSTGGSTDSLNPSYNSDNDLQELLLGNTGNRDEVNFNVSGGQKGLVYYTSLNFQNDKSIILNSYSKNIQSRLNISYQVSPKVKYSNNISFYWQDKNGMDMNNVVRPLFERPSLSLIYYPDGSLTSYINSKRNPVANAIYETRETEQYNTQVNNQLEFELAKGLRFTNAFNAILNNSEYNYFAPRYVLNAAKNINEGTNNTARDFKWEFQSYLNYNKTIANDHSLSGTLGVSADKRTYKFFNLQYNNTVSEAITTVFPAYINSSLSRTSGTRNASASLFGRANYSYKGKYIVQGVYRRDGSSRFGAENKFGNFYSGSALWRFSDEKFMDWAKNVLYNGKLRLSVGQVGNDQIGDFASQTLIGFNGSYNGAGGASANQILGNPYIMWETVTTKDVGADLEFFSGRLTFTTDYYIKNTSNLLYTSELPKETGFGNISVNVGKIQNKGLELAVSGNPVNSNNFKWTTSANITFERGKVLRLSGGAPFVAGSSWYVEEGGRIGNFFGWKNLGVYQWDESNAYNNSWEKLTVVLGTDGKPLYENGKPVYNFNGQRYTGTVHNLYDPAGKYKGGDTEWKNLNADSLINDADRHVIGNAQPDYYLGISNQLSYKKFSLSFLFNASFGGQVYNQLQYVANNQSNTGAGSPDVVYNSWLKQGDIAKYPYYPTKDARGSVKNNGNSIYLENSSFIRLQSMRFTYSLPQGLLKKVYIKGLSAYAYGTNLVTWTNYRGFDPEFSNSNALQPGYDIGRYPKRREFGLGLNANF
ncbi:SusC/RagA family TonB-linked outer membrane protein [Pedobacter sp. HMF7056]|uniref:SusC/RagA family TonB-linked outer membrane protein n=2 Tax=Hufsiella ginkgonis TaxID=2695274 RepID=A0A7K1XVG2_9SPHI|nr:SusC/RagA family TonB-linked outer membrane protein [Hufsiella ginkgonis]